MRHLPSLLLLAVGMAPCNAWAVLQAPFNRGFTFARTPKGARRSYRLSAGRMVWVEAGLAVYSLAAFLFALSTSNLSAAFLPLLGWLGFAYVVGRAWREGRAAVV